MWNVLSPSSYIHIFWKMHSPGNTYTFTGTGLSKYRFGKEFFLNMLKNIFSKWRTYTGHYILNQKCEVTSLLYDLYLSTEKSMTHISKSWGSGWTKYKFQSSLEREAFLIKFRGCYLALKIPMNNSTVYWVLTMPDIVYCTKCFIWMLNNHNSTVNYKHLCQLYILYKVNLDRVSVFKITRNELCYQK